MRGKQENKQASWGDGLDTVTCCLESGSFVGMTSGRTVADAQLREKERGRNDDLNSDLVTI
jgi:hypothetical protein